jgi:hypothetical protein
MGGPAREAVEESRKFRTTAAVMDLLRRQLFLLIHRISDHVLKPEVESPSEEALYPEMECTVLFLGLVRI